MFMRIIQIKKGLKAHLITLHDGDHWLRVF